MLPALVLVPAVAGLLAFAIRADKPRRSLLMALAIADAAMTAILVF